MIRAFTLSFIVFIFKNDCRDTFTLMVHGQLRFCIGKKSMTLLATRAQLANTYCKTTEGRMHSIAYITTVTDFHYQAALERQTHYHYSCTTC